MKPGIAGLFVAMLLAAGCRSPEDPPSPQAGSPLRNQSLPQKADAAQIRASEQDADSTRRSASKDPPAAGPPAAPGLGASAPTPAQREDALAACARLREGEREACRSRVQLSLDEASRQETPDERTRER